MWLENGESLFRRDVLAFAIEEEESSTKVSRSFESHSV